MSFRFRRGEYLKDIVTGFRGVVVSRADHLTGCNQYFLQPRVDKDMSHLEGRWFDEITLQVDPEFHGETLKLYPIVDQPPG